MPELKDLVPPYIMNLPPYPRGKEWRGEADLVRLSANENPLGPSPQAVRAITEALQGIHRYPDGAGTGLKKELAGRLRVASDQIILGNGSNEIIELVARTFLQGGGEAILPTPTFAYYRIAVQAQGGSCLLIPLKNFKIDLLEMGEQVNAKTKVIFLSNPNNPTGTIFTGSEFDSFLTHLPPSVVVVVDEAYGEYVTNRDYPAIHDYQQRGQWIITTKTFSKFYGLAGLRIGYGVARKELIETLEKVRQPFSANYLAQKAAEATLADRGHQEKTAHINTTGKAYLSTELTRQGLTFVPTEANFILVHIGPKAAQAVEELLRQGVVVRGMTGYGLAEYIRVSIGRPDENRRFVEALQRWVKGS
jgi:histidinol-phosphate aminotransferase